VFGKPSTGKPNRAGSNLTRIYCRCPVPPAMTHGVGSWRSRSKTAYLPAVPRSLLHLLALRPRSPLLWRGMPRTSPAPATAQCQSAVPTEPRGAARSSRSSTGIPVSPPATVTRRDGSIFPFGPFPGIIRVWNGPCRRAASGGASFTSDYAGAGAALPDLRPYRALHRSVSTHSTTKVNPA